MQELPAAARSNSTIMPRHRRFYALSSVVTGTATLLSDFLDFPCRFLAWEVRFVKFTPCIHVSPHRSALLTWNSLPTSGPSFSGLLVPSQVLLSRIWVSRTFLSFVLKHFTLDHNLPVCAAFYSVLRLSFRRAVKHL